MRYCSRHYFIPSPRDFLDMQRAPRRLELAPWEWDTTMGTPLGELRQPRIPSGSWELVDWPNFRGLLDSLDRGCAGRCGRLWEHCPQCLRATLPSYFLITDIHWERARQWGTSVPTRPWTCRLWGEDCPGVPQDTSSKEDDIDDHQVGDEQADRPMLDPDAWEEDSPRSRNSNGKPRASWQPDEQSHRSPPESPETAARDQAITSESRSTEAVFPPIPKLDSLEHRGIIQAWFAELEQLCSQRKVPAGECLRWAAASLEGEAAAVWESRLNVRCDGAPTLFEMKETFLQRHREWHSVHSLWGAWTELKQYHGESALKYSARARDLKTRKDLPDHWAAAAFVHGIPEPNRSQIRRLLIDRDDPALTLDGVGNLLVKYEEILRRRQAKATSSHPEPLPRAVPGAVPPPQGRTTALETSCWICGDRHNWPVCPQRKDSGCPSCGGSCPKVRHCPKGWYARHPTKGKTTGTQRTGPLRSEAKDSLRQWARWMYPQEGGVYWQHDPTRFGVGTPRSGNRASQRRSKHD